MIPGVNNLRAVETAEIPSQDYKMELDENRVLSLCDGSEVMQQVVYHILNTERYKYPVYSWNYGVELNDLYGKPLDYVMSEIQRRIIEALIQDDRIESVDGFKFDTQEGALHMTFTVHTVFGDLNSEKRWENV